MKPRALRSFIPLAAMMISASACNSAPEGEPSQAVETQAQAYRNNVSRIAQDAYFSDFSSAVEVNGHVKGEASTRWGICTGTLISSRVVVTAKHCVTAMDQVSVRPTFATNDSPIPVSNFVLHTSPRIDVAAIILPAAVSVETIAKIPTNADYNGIRTTAGVDMIGRLINGTTVTNGFARAGSSAVYYPSTSGGATLNPGSMDEYLFLAGADAENGDSGGACGSMRWQQTGNEDRTMLTGIAVAVVHHRDAPADYRATLCVRTDVIGSWLNQIIATNAFVASSSSAFTQYQDYKAIPQWDVNMDVWRMLR